MKKILALAFSLVSTGIFANETYVWTVDKVTDGDTIKVKEVFWPAELGQIKVRVNGIDTPEKGRFSKCKFEDALAKKATLYLETKLKSGDKITVKNVKKDKYGGRVVADVFYSNGVSVSQDMISQKYAVVYHGNAKKNWCIL